MDLEQASPHRYWAFISYSHCDTAIAKWLHRSLEQYRVPRSLQNSGGPLPRRLFPVFRDREEIPTSSDLGATIRTALETSQFLIVICSPDSARSRWVEEEIRGFKQMHGEDRVLGLIVRGEPNGTDKPRFEEEECFPFAFCHRIAPDGTAEQIEPIAADIRPGQDTRKVALLRLVAGILGVAFDSLWQRERRRKTQRIFVASAAAAVVVGTLTVLSLLLTAEQSRSKTASREAALSKSQKYFQEYVDDMRSLPNLWQQDRVDLIRARLERHGPTNSPSVATQDVRGFEWFYWNRRAHSAVATLQTGSRISSLDVSADGNTVWFTDSKTRLVSWDVSTGTNTILRDGSLRNYYVAGAPAGDRVLVLTLGDQKNPLGSMEVLDSAGSRKALTQSPRGEFTCAAFSPDGSRIVTGSSLGEVEVWDAQTLKSILNLTRNPNSRRDNLSPTRLIDMHTGFVTEVAFSPDGTTVVSADIDAGLAVWESATGKCVTRQNVVGSGGVVSGVAFSRDGTKIITRSLPEVPSSRDRSVPGEVLVWDKAAKSEHAKLEFKREQRAVRPGGFNSIPLAEAGALFTRYDAVIAAAVENVLRTYDPATGNAVDERKGHGSRITALRSARDGERIVTADVSGEVNVWNLGRGPCGNVDQSWNSTTRGFVMSAATGRRAVLRDFNTASQTEVLRFADANQIFLYDGEREIEVQDGNTNYVGLAASKSGRFFASSLNSRVRVWDFATGRIVRDFPPLVERGSSSFRGLAFRNDDELFVIGSKSVHILRMNGGDSFQSLNIPIGDHPGYNGQQLNFSPNTAMCLAFSHDSRSAALGNAGGDVVIFETERWTEVQRLRGHLRGVKALFFSRDGHRLFSCSGRYVQLGVAEESDAPGEVKVWDLNTGRDCLTLTPPGSHEFSGLALSEDELELFVACNPVGDGLSRLGNGKLFSWDTRSHRPEHLFVAQAAPAPADTLTGKELRYASLALGIGGDFGLTSFAIHPSGDYIVAVDVVGAVILWNCRSGEIVRTTALRKTPSWFLKFIQNGAVLYATTKPMGSEALFLKFPELTSIPRPVGESFPDGMALRLESRAWSNSFWSLELAETANKSMTHVHVRNMETDKLSKVPHAYEENLRGAALFPDNEHFATLSAQNRIHIWSLKAPAVDPLFRGGGRAGPRAAGSKRPPIGFGPGLGAEQIRELRSNDLAMVPQPSGEVAPVGRRVEVLRGGAHESPRAQFSRTNNFNRFATNTGPRGPRTIPPPQSRLPGLPLENGQTIYLQGPWAFSREADGRYVPLADGEYRLRGRPPLQIVDGCRRP